MRIDEAVRYYFSVSDHSGDENVKGKALEDLVCDLLPRVPGIVFFARRSMNPFLTEEVDVAFAVDSKTCPLSFIGHVLIAECKNWSRPATGDEVILLDRLLTTRNATFGLLIAAQGITGNSLLKSRAHFEVMYSLGQGRHIVVVTRAELEALRSDIDLTELIRQKYLRLKVNGTSFEN